MERESIAILVLNWNSYELTKNCLESLFSCSYNSFRIYLVDNGSKDKSGNSLQLEFGKRLEFISLPENIGFTGGNNKAISQALKNEHDYIMLLNNDTEVEAGFIEPLIKQLNEGDNVGAVQPLIFALGTSDQIWNAGGLTNKFLGISRTLFEGRKYEEVKGIIPKKVDWLTGCCILIPTNILKEVGWALDGRFFAYHEDVDLSIRLRKKGYELNLVQESVIYHKSNASLKSSSKGKEGFLSPFLHYLNIRNHILLLRKHKDYFNPLGSFTTQVLKVLGYSIYFILRGRFGKLKAVAKGARDGLIL